MYVCVCMYVYIYMFLPNKTGYTCITMLLRYGKRTMLGTRQTIEQMSMSNLRAVYQATALFYCFRALCDSGRRAARSRSCLTLCLSTP